MESSHHMERNIIAALFSVTVPIFVLLFPVAVLHAASATVTVSPDPISLGDTATVSWSSSGTFKCVGSGFDTGGKTSGSKTVKPSSTGVKTYSVSCYVTSPSCTLEQKDTFVEDGPGPNTCQGITYEGATCAPNGAQCRTSEVVSRGVTWRHTIWECVGECTTVSASDTVTVNNPPPPPPTTEPFVDITASPMTVAAESSTLISWRSSGMTTCRGTNFSTGGATKGSVPAEPTKDTTYTVVCDGKTGSSSTSGTWQYVGKDITDLWCTQIPGKYSNFYTNNECSSSNPEGQACTGNETCAVNSWTGGPESIGGPRNYCNLVSDLYRCDGGSAPKTYTDNVTVSVNRAPNAPTIAGPVSGIPATEYTFSFKASDPDGDKVRYRIDWDGNNSFDQTLPGSGYTASNTLLNALRAWANIGAYTFRARTQDENGLFSGWASHTIAIGVDSEPQCSDGEDNDTDGLTDETDPGCSRGGFGASSSLSKYDPNDNNEREPQCSDGRDNNGVNGTDYPDDPACSSAEDDDEGAPPPAELSLSANRLLVAPNTPITLTWIAANVKSDSCTLSGTNGDSWGPFSEGDGSQLSAQIVAETDFILSCQDFAGEKLSRSLTVRIAPRYREK